MYGGRWTGAADWPAFRAAVAAGVREGGLHVVELRTERHQQRRLHRRLWPLVQAALPAVEL